MNSSTPDRFPGLPAGPGGFRGARRTLLLFFVAVAVFSFVRLGLDWRGLVPTEGGQELAGRFFRAALHPAWDYETPPHGDAPPLLQRVGRAALDTLRYAATAVSLSLLFGVILGFFGSTAWWADEARGGIWRRIVVPAVYGLTRFFITLCRSIHELIWAVLLLSAMGFTPLAAVIAITIPYSGTLAKVFSEMIDEVPRDTVAGLRAIGGSPLQMWALGLVPRALPDLFSYALYRFECGLRSSSVLGFMGFGSLGLYLQQSFDNSDFRETWTYLYALLAMVLVFDLWGGLIRQHLSAPRSRPGGPRAGLPVIPGLDALRRTRPRDAVVRLSMAALAGIVLFSWLTLDFQWGEFEPARRWRNVQRFLTEIMPLPYREPELATWRGWLGGILRGYAFQATLTTLWISILSIVLAGAGAFLLLPFAARTIARPAPWTGDGRPAPRLAAGLWALVRNATRFLLIVLRSIPEIILAFVFLALTGGSIWPAVLALSLHNAGILGRLGAETVENVRADIPAALRATGGERLPVLTLALLPMLLPRFLLYFFYRWETCLRETTALGILGCASLGFYIREAQSRLRFDEMMILILLGAALVIAGDITSALVRRWARRAV